MIRNIFYIKIIIRRFYMGNTNDLMNKHDVIEFLKINERTYQNFIKDGRLKPLKSSPSSKSFRFLRSDVEKIFQKPKGIVIPLLNNKGGVGKTFITQNVGYSFSKLGKTIIIDLDSQGNLSHVSGIDISKLEIGHFVERKIQNITDNFDILPANLTLSALEKDLFISGMNRERWLDENIIKPLRSKYDYIILDNAPSVGLFNTNSLICADLLVIPIIPDTLSLIGMNTILDLYHTVKKEFNLCYDFRIVMNKYATGTTSSDEIWNMINNEYHDKLFPYQIKNKQIVINSMINNHPVKTNEYSEMFILLRDYLIGSI